MNIINAYQATMDRMIQAIEGYEMPDEIIDGEGDWELQRMVRIANKVREEQ